MGGQGSGVRFGESPKITVEECKTINIDKLKKQKSLFGTITFSHGDEVEKVDYVLINQYFLLSYIVTDYDGQVYEVKEEIPLQNTRPHIGGLRFWFTCPNCNRRVRTLHCPHGAQYFRCRTCYDLTYQSCQDSHKYDNIHEKLAVVYGISPEEAKKEIEQWGSESIDLIK